MIFIMKSNIKKREWLHMHRHYTTTRKTPPCKTLLVKMTGIKHSGHQTWRVLKITGMYTQRMQNIECWEKKISGHTLLTGIGSIPFIS